MTGLSATMCWLLQRTTSIRAAKPLLARLVRQSIGELTGRAAFPSHGLGSRNRLDAAARRVDARLGR